MNISLVQCIGTCVILPICNYIQPNHNICNSLWYFSIGTNHTNHDINTPLVRLYRYLHIAVYMQLYST